MMKKFIISIIPVLVLIGCAGNVSIQTHTPKDTDLEIIIKSKKNES